MIAPSTPPRRRAGPRPCFPIQEASLNATNPPAKRKRLTRSRTGCRECRRLHVKCAEGALLPTGGKAPCRRCWSTDQTCWYPFPAGGYPNSRKRRTGERAKRNVELEERSWERAEDVGVWVGESPSSGESVSADSVSPEGVASVSPSTACGLHGTAPLVAPAAGHPGPPDTATPWSIASAVSAVTQHVFDSAPWFSDPGVPGASPADLPADLLTLLLAPSAPLQSFTLSSLSSSPDDRAAVSYFETRGCNDITAAPRPADNWIYAQLFPHLLGILSTDSPMASYTHLALIQISYTHRGNMEPDEARAALFRAKASGAKQRGTCALLRAKARAAEWETEEYLIGFFIRCIADVLSSGRIDVHGAAKLDCPTSPLYASLRDLIATYSIVQFACSPFGLASVVLELPEAIGHDWTAAAFGCSRASLRLLSRVSSMVARRVAVLQGGDDGAGALLAAEAAALVVQLEMPDWEVAGSRIQRGTMVMRYALRTMLLCEMLDTDLDDPRIKVNRDAAHEIVADCDPGTMTGFQWQLAVLAIYTRDVLARAKMSSLLELALGMGLGPNYRGTLDVLEVCWDVLDTKGAYEHGIAPWREAMHALGRNLWV